MEEGAVHTPLHLYFQNADGSATLSAASFRTIAAHLRDYYEVIYSDWHKDPQVAVTNDPKCRAALDELEALIKGNSQPTPTVLRPAKG